MKQSQPTVLVTDTNRGSAIAIIRSLGRKGWRVIAADSDVNSIGFRSRYAQHRFIYPDPETAAHQLATALYDGVQKHRVDLLIPVTDAIILPLIEARARFDGVCKLAMPASEALAVASNKFKTFQLGEQLGVPTPRTHLVYTVQEACEKGVALGWPVVLKPQASRLLREQSRIETFSVCYAENLDQLAQQMQRFEGRCPVLLQEYCPGIGHGVELLMHAGQPLAAFQHKRLREVPINGGASAFRESVTLDPLLYDYAVRLLKALHWTGLAMVEFKVGKSGARLMEINGRVWGSLPLAVRSGVDFPGRLAELYLYGPPPQGATPDLNYMVGVRARNLELDMLWIATVLQGKRKYPFLKMPSRREGIVALLELFNPTYRYDILSFEDPRPGLVELPKIARKLYQKMKDAI